MKLTVDPVKDALSVAFSYGGTDGAHHKAWVIDQMIRALINCPRTIKRHKCHDGSVIEDITYGESEEYKKFVKGLCAGGDGPDTYEWDPGIAP